LLGILVFNVAQLTFKDWILWEMNASPTGQPPSGISFDSFRTILKVHELLVALIHAVAVVLLARAVLLGRRKETEEA
jgi:hypothetical protein